MISWSTNKNLRFLSLKMSKKSKNFQDSAKKIYIRTFGCQMNDRDSEALLGLFVDKGYLIAESAEEADAVLVNTCSVRAHAEDRARSYLGSLKKKGPVPIREQSPKKILGLIGCMAKNKGEELYERMPYIDLICGPASFSKIPEYVKRIKEEGIRIKDLEDKEREEDFYKAAFRQDSDRAQVIISTGCSNYCSYCIVPFVRGELRLRKPGDIIDEVKRNISSGIKNITLLGQNVNDYDFKLKTQYSILNTNFVDLLKMVNKIEGLESLDFITSQPKNTSKELFTLIKKSPKIRKHLHLPFQSGSNRILKLMKRGYTREKYLQLVDDYRKIVGGTLSTDVIVGFSTESGEDFNQTKDILEKVKFSHAFIFKYSPRGATKSVGMADDVAREVKASRHKILLDLQKEISLGK